MTRKHPAKFIQAEIRRLAVGFGAVFLSFLSITGALAAERDAHVHGQSHLDVAIEGQTVELHLVSPGANIVGFEHMPATAEDKAAVVAAMAILKDGSKLFLFPAGAGCRLEEVDVDSTQAGEGHGNNEKHEDLEKSSKNDDDHKHETHAEFQAQYRFHCEHADRVTHIDVKIFEHFPATRELDVQTISLKGQGAQELAPTSARLNL